MASKPLDTGFCSLARVRLVVWGSGAAAGRQYVCMLMMMRWDGREGQSGQSLTLGDLLSGFCEDVYYLVDIVNGGAKTVGGVIR